MSTVWFVVDDTDTRLSYTGSDWSFVANTGVVNDTTDNEADIDAMSTTGPAFNSTLHRMTGNGTISFQFNGSGFLGVYGTIDGDAGSSLPDIFCSLDGESMVTFGWDLPGLDQFANNIIVCLSYSSIPSPEVSPGEHELLINVTNLNSDWYFDYITYESLVNPVLDGEILQAGNAEQRNPSDYSSMLTFGPGWVQSSNGSLATTIPGSEATMKFNGTSLSLYGTLNGNISNTAMYTVDERNPVGFELPGPATAASLENQLLFTASNLSAGEHTVVVAFNGTTQGMPLEIGYFLVTSLTAAQQASLSLPSSSTATQKTGRAVVAFAMVAVTIRLWIRRSKRLKSNSVIPFQSEDMGHDVGPMIYKNHDKNRLSGLMNKDVGSLDAARSSELPGYEGYQPSSTNILTMKLQQRLIAMRDQIEQRDRQLAEGFMQQHSLLTVHTDSGLRGIEEDSLDPGLEVPPGYTQA
ncbi:hypothetical protein BDP27DRAFT_1378475 [Rhodocollybia butyracea]|uniref:Uncharacterized protein n=1 Tax=Rhodocollybia butyracea TaxID=206335 RepID=A0A9P5P2L2_9AGAR|nr:hypothetical protein BDP27DRAFT_1378475 [Rhodocollybia butyracea]